MVQKDWTINKQSRCGGDWLDASLSSLLYVEQQPSMRRGSCVGGNCWAPKHGLWLWPNQKLREQDSGLKKNKVRSVFLSPSLDFEERWLPLIRMMLFMNSKVSWRKDSTLDGLIHEHVKWRQHGTASRAPDLTALWPWAAHLTCWKLFPNL